RAHTATLETTPLSLHDALPIWRDKARERRQTRTFGVAGVVAAGGRHPEAALAGKRSTALTVGPAAFQHLVEPVLQQAGHAVPIRSEEHTSELQSPDPHVCRLLL